MADLDTNSLIITARGETLESLLQVIERLDIRRSNILIEAIIAEVSDTLNRDLGVEWFFTDEDNGAFGSSVNATARFCFSCLHSGNSILGFRRVLFMAGAALSKTI